jgi:hypothetical protein
MKVAHICSFCNFNFKRKDNLLKHLKENRCEIGRKMTLLDMHERISSLQNKVNGLSISGNENETNINSKNHIHNTINIAININPVTKLNLDYIDPEKMKRLIEECSPDHTKMRLLLSGYLQEIFCNKEHPENHSVKYIKKYPPTFNSKIQDSNGKTIDVIKGLKDTCDILTDPVLDVLKIKLNECIKKYKKNDFFDYDMYEETIRTIKEELQKPAIKAFLSSFLQNDILNNIEMKLNIKQTCL